MNIKDAQRCKEEMEVFILQAVQEFERTSGCQVNSIDLDRIGIGTMEDVNASFVNRVSLHVSL
jgi:hypothetical protein